MTYINGKNEWMKGRTNGELQRRRGMRRKAIGRRIRDRREDF